MASVDSLDPNLLSSGKQRGSNSAPKIDSVIKRARPIRATLKIVAYLLIFLFSLLLFLVLKMPPSMVSNFVLGKINENSPTPIEAKSIGFSLWGLPHLSIEGMTVQFNPPLSLSQVNVYPSLLHLFSMAKSPGSFYGSAEVDAFDTHLSSTFALSDTIAFSLKSENLSLAKVPYLLENNMGVSGVLETIVFDLNLENKKLSKMDGAFAISAKALRFDPASIQAYMPLPILDLGTANAVGKVQKGVIRFEKLQIGNATKDLEALVDGEIRLNDNWEYSSYNLKIRFKVSDKILKAVPSLPGMLNIIAAKKTDGYYATKASGSFNAPNPAMPDL